MTEDQILDVIEMAGFGIGYWAYDAVVDPKNRTYTIYSDDLDEPAVIGFDKIAEVPKDYDLEQLGSWEADYLVQTAAFGDTIFG